jgi:hypothetical protein
LSCPNLKEVPANAFCNTPLRKIELPECSSIGKEAFINCTYLTKVLAPKLEKIEDKTFYNSGNLLFSDFNEVKEIGAAAFCDESV